MRNLLRLIRELRRYPYQGECLDGIRKGWFPVFVRYPVRPQPRFGYGDRPPHTQLVGQIGRGMEQYSARLRELRPHWEGCLRIPQIGTEASGDPYWDNRWFSGLDGVVLYALLAQTRPRLYLEIGSGHSTRFARQCIRDHALATRVVCIDPQPRAEIRGLADEILPTPLEETDLRILDPLQAGDILFVDSSHRCFMNSDVTVLFLEVMPRLPAGVLIHLHDIHLPFDYPPERALHYESEQYLLAAMLLCGCPGYEIVLPHRFVLSERVFDAALAEFWAAGIPRRGTSFWFRKL